jgi:hypothetical protein
MGGAFLVEYEIAQMYSIVHAQLKSEILVSELLPVLSPSHSVEVNDSQSIALSMVRSAAERIRIA